MALWSLCVCLRLWTWRRCSSLLQGEYTPKLHGRQIIDPHQPWVQRSTISLWASSQIIAIRIFMTSLRFVIYMPLFTLIYWTIHIFHDKPNLDGEVYLENHCLIVRLNLWVIAVDHHLVLSNLSSKRPHMKIPIWLEKIENFIQDWYAIA